MLQQALQKIQREVTDNPDNGYISYIGAELIKFIRSNEDKASLFLADDKTIQGSLLAMRKVAEKKKSGNMAVLTPDEGMTIVLEYYGIQKQIAEPEPVAAGFSLNVDDLL